MSGPTNTYKKKKLHEKEKPPEKKGQGKQAAGRKKR